MSDNPMVIFIDKARSKSCGLEIPFDLPCGWNERDELGPLTEGGSYKILLLEDSQPVPILNYANKNPNTPLLVIGHLGTNHHKDSVAGAVSQCGKPIVVAKYHHMSKEKRTDDSTFHEICKLIEREISAQEFLLSFKSINLKNAYLTLAAISQIWLLDESIDTRQLVKGCTDQLPEQEKKEIFDLPKQNGKPTATDLLKLIHNKVSEYNLI